jgi:hypothetical protein
MGPCDKSCSYPEFFKTYLSGSPVKDTPPHSRPSPLCPFRDRRTIPRAPFIQVSKSHLQVLTRHLILFVITLYLEDPKVWKQKYEYNTNNFKTVPTSHVLSNLTTRLFFVLLPPELKCWNRKLPPRTYNFSITYYNKVLWQWYSKNQNSITKA